MSEKTLIMFEISQKQQFIFRTNRLLENIGSSHIIRELTTNPIKLFNNSNFKNYLKEPIDLPEASYRIVGGGSATFIFDKKEDAQTFARNLSKSVIKYLPSIELFLVSKTINWSSEYLYQTKNNLGVINELRDELARKKNQRKHSVKQLSWGIQQSCISSGLPANTMIKDIDSEEAQPRAEEFKIILDIGKNTRNDEYYKRFVLDNPYLEEPEQYTLLTEDVLQKVFYTKNSANQKSYLAIISIDGNAMGVKVSKFFEQTFENNEQFINEYKNFTQRIDNAYTDAFRKTIHFVMERYDIWAKDFYGEAAQEKECWKKIIPIRPIIASGDDITFITYGKLGIEIAKTFIQNLQQQTITIGPNKHTYHFEACAGVAIVRHKYPFWLGFEIANQLCANAKKRLKADEQKWLELGMGTAETPYDTSLIDWQLISHSDTVQDIATYRNKYFQTEDEVQLVMRPYYIQPKNAKIKHFANYEEAFKNVAIKAIQQSKENEQNTENKNKNFPSTSKWKTLLDKYHEGKRTVNQWRILNQFSPSGNQDMNDKLFYSYKDGFGTLHEPHDENGQYFAAYYDAIEIFDFFIDLSGRDID